MSTKVIWLKYKSNDYQLFFCCIQLDMEVFLIVDSSAELSHLSRLSTELSMNKGGALSVVNLDKESTK